ATEDVVNRLLAERLGASGHVDFLVPSFVVERDGAARLLARSRAHDVAIYGEWAALLAGLDGPLGYLECRGLDWETPDRHPPAAAAGGPPPAPAARSAASASPSGAAAGRRRPSGASASTWLRPSCAASLAPWPAVRYKAARSRVSGEGGTSCPRLVATRTALG